MFEYLKNILTPQADQHINWDRGKRAGKSSINKYQIATAALLIEIAKADGDFSDEERNRIIELMKNYFELDDDLVDELLELSEQKVNDSISVYEFSSIINESFTNQEKFELMKNLWRVIYEDGKLDSHEDQLIKIIGGTLNLEHKDVIGAKLFVKQELGKE
jgi:uncharacterized tellurite resistance protein B-like protein